MKKYYYILILVMFSSANGYAEESDLKYRGFMEDSLTDTKSNELHKYYAGIYLNLCLDLLYICTGDLSINCLHSKAVISR